MRLTILLSKPRRNNEQTEWMHGPLYYRSLELHSVKHFRHKGDYSASTVLDNDRVTDLTHILRDPRIDLFASRLNTQCNL